MKPSPSFGIRTLHESDLPAGMRLKAQAGWNQTEADWQRLLALEPAGCFAAEIDGEVVGTAVACLFGSVAWVAMMLVDERHRSRGLGRALLEKALTFAEVNGARSIRLDATPMGQPLYEKLGFVEEFRLHRHGGKLLAREDANKTTVDRATPADLDDVLSLDRDVTRTDRAKLITRLFQECADHFWVARREDVLAGYLTGRPGARAWFLGPCIADEAGPALLARAARAWAGREVFVDIVEGHPATAWAVGRGLAPLRPLVRMGRGPRVAEDRDRLWASSGPEKG